MVLQGVRLVVAVSMPVIPRSPANFDISLIPLAFAYAVVTVPSS